MIVFFFLFLCCRAECWQHIKIVVFVCLVVCVRVGNKRNVFFCGKQTKHYGSLRTYCMRMGVIKLDRVLFVVVIWISLFWMIVCLLLCFCKKWLMNVYVSVVIYYCLLKMFHLVSILHGTAVYKGLKTLQHFKQQNPLWIMHIHCLLHFVADRIDKLVKRWTNRLKGTGFRSSPRLQMALNLTN